MKKRGRTILAALLSVICLFAVTTDVQAASYAGIHLEDGRDCTVELTFIDEDSYNNTDPVYIDGVQLSLIKVADLEPDGTYTLLDAFSGMECWDAYIGGSASAANVQQAADSAVAIAESGNVPTADQQVTGTDGKAVLTASAESGYGIYLLYQTGKAEGSTAEHYTKISATLVQLPQMQDTTWNYNVTLEPKPLKNDGFSVKVKKRAGKDNKATEEIVEGAELSIRSAEDDSEIEEQWTTSSIDHDSALLQPGSYILREDKAPDGYTKADDIAFELTVDGKLLVNEEQQESLEIVMIDNVVEKNAPPVKTTNVGQKIRKVITGDVAHIGLLVLLAAAVVILIIVFAVRGRKKQDK